MRSALVAVTGVGLSWSVPKRCPAQSPASASGVLFEDLIIRPRPGVQEVTLAKLKDGRYWLFFGEDKRLVQKFSSDRGRTWGETTKVRGADGSEIPLARNTPHLSLLHLPSGNLGIIYGGPYARPGRDGTILYRTSRDGGKTWSQPVVVDALFAICRTQGARVLTTGRIVAPVFKWLSARTGGEAEGPQHSINFSWVYYSDDEGKTWKRSLSELFVSIDEGRHGAYSFEEPCVVEFKDGRVLMYGRTELGQFYQSISEDGGVSWSVPKPVPLPASYTPPMLVRIPGTGDLLLIWNQVSGEESLAGLSRHRLSTAISKDDGVTWGQFQNLESLDERERLRPSPSTPRVYRMVAKEYRQPVDRARYTRAPGNLRICYPTVVFHENEVAFTYDYGFGPGEYQRRSGTKIKIVSLDWLYGE